MSYWVSHSKDVRLPDWLRAHLPDKCDLCGSEMLNYYNDGLRCTNRKCSNEYCYGYVAARTDTVRKMVGVDGVGYARCLTDAKMIDAKSPFDLLNFWGIKPEVSLGLFLRMHCFEGVDSEWDKITQSNSLYTLDELYEKYDGKWKQLLLDHKEFIYNNQKYVRLKARPVGSSTTGPLYVFNIMITGTPNGFNTKEHFIDTMNELCKGKIVITHQKTAKQSGVHCLIREKGSTTRGKVAAAKKGDIPIMTSDQFMLALAKLLTDNNSETR